MITAGLAANPRGTTPMRGSDGPMISGVTPAEPEVGYEWREGNGNIRLAVLISEALNVTGGNPHLAMWSGAMGSRPVNFYSRLCKRYGRIQEAGHRQELYLDH